MTPKEISKLLPLLAKHGVESFKLGGLEVTFRKEASGEPLKPLIKAIKAYQTKFETSSVPTTTDQQQTSDAGLAQQIDGELAYDQVLNWSASPGVNDPAVPLAGDAASLTSETH